MPVRGEQTRVAKHVVLVNKHRVRPETMLALQEARDGDLIEVEPNEMEAFQSIVIYVASDHPSVVTARDSRKLREASNSSRKSA